MKRIFDLFLASLIVTTSALPLFLIALAVRLTSLEQTLYCSDRVGKHNKPFKMPKFRTMSDGAPMVASHLLAEPIANFTSISGFLRKNSLDKLPEL